VTTRKAVQGTQKREREESESPSEKKNTLFLQVSGSVIIYMICHKSVPEWSQAVQSQPRYHPPSEVINSSALASAYRTAGFQVLDKTDKMTRFGEQGMK
jgi:hypothetical protein